jgi:hypothetical protein
MKKLIVNHLSNIKHLLIILILSVSINLSTLILILSMILSNSFLKIIYHFKGSITSSKEYL